MKLTPNQIKAFVKFAAQLEIAAPGQKIVCTNLSTYRDAGLIIHNTDDDSVSLTKKGRNLILKAQQQ